MSKVIKLPIDGGNFVSAIEVPYDTKSEDWNAYDLHDSGTRVRVKTIVQKIYRVVDDSGNQIYNPDGEPSYIVRHGTIVTVSE